MVVRVEEVVLMMEVAALVMAAMMVGLVIAVVMSTPETMVSLTSSFHTRGIITDGCYCFSV